MSQLKKALWILFLLPICLLCFHSGVLAAGKIILEPRVSAAYQYDNNFWRAEEDDQEAPVSTYLVNPGVRFGYETAKSQIYLDYELPIYWYDDIDSVKPGNRKASDDDYVGQALNLAAGTRQINERLLIGLKEDFYLTRDQSYSDEFSDSRLRNKYYVNRFEPVAFYDFSRRLTAGVRYRNTQTDYKESYLEDSSENRGLGDVVYNLSPTASLNLDYQIWRRSYSKNTSTYDSNQIMLIFRKQYKYLFLDGGAGYHRREWDDPALDTEDIVPWRVGIKLATEPVQLSPLYPDLSEPKSFVSLRAEHNLNDQGINENYYKAYRVSLHAGHVLWERIALGINAYYQKSKYLFREGATSSGAIEKRDDDTYYLDIELGYVFTRWLELSVNPGIEKRDSNWLGYSYTNPLIMVNLTFSYELGESRRK